MLREVMRQKRKQERLKRMKDEHKALVGGSDAAAASGAFLVVGGCGPVCACLLHSA